MKRLLPVLLAAACARAPERPACFPVQSLETKVAISVPRGVVAAELADEPGEREVGLMCRASLAPGAGMLFAFEREQPLQFWMKQTLIPLDMVWIGADKRVTGVSANVAASAVETPDALVARAGGKARWVLELGAGEAARLGIRTGTKLGFELPAR